MTGPAVAWRRRFDAPKRVWMRLDDVLVVGDDLIDIRSGAAFSEPPWEFLGLRSWSLQRWEPWMIPAGAQGPHGGDLCESRLWDGLLVVAKRGGDWPELTMLVEARDVASREVAWRHRVSGPDDYSMWAGWLAAEDGTVIERPDGRFHGHSRLDYPAPESGSRRWSLSWDTWSWPDAEGPGTDADQIVLIFDSYQPAVGGVAVGSGTMAWRIDLHGAVPAVVRACGDYAVVCSFPADVNRFAPQISHAPSPPIELVGECACQFRTGTASRPNTCAWCGGFLAPWMTVTVHDRRTGTALWSHRWPWHEKLAILASVEALTIVNSAGGQVIVTQEGDYLHARRLADGSRVRTIAARDVPSLTPRLNAFPFIFRQPERRGLIGWIWLYQQRGSVAEGTRMSADVLIHPDTGEQVELTNVLYVSDEGLAVCVTGDTITCYALSPS